MLPALCAALLATGCSTTVAGTAVSAGPSARDRSLVTEYFDGLNAAGRAGSSAQRDFLRKTQHPDFTDRLCDLGDITLFAEPAMSTLRADPKWVPPGLTRPPRGTVFVIAVSLSVRQGGANIGEQIGSERLVVLNGSAYGFAPCPS